VDGPRRRARYSVSPNVEKASSTLAGIGFAAGAFFCFPLHDAIIKWLLQHYGIEQILLIRSGTALSFAVGLGGGTKVVTTSIKSPALGMLVGRAFVIMAAWATFYTAAKTLKLAELISIYFSSPLLVAVLAFAILGERINRVRWICLWVGFAGVVVACRPDGTGNSWAIGMAVLASILWAWSMILIRQLGSSESTAVQMFISNAVIFACCAMVAPLTSWRMPSLFDIGLLLSVGVVGAGAQYLLFESAKRAVAAIVASMEFTSLVWAFLFGYLIWRDVPRLSELVGAALIIASGSTMIGAEWRTFAKYRSAAKTADSGTEVCLARGRHCSITDRKQR
jgi:drug/metabolite transporter (DMT)-like permease